MYRVTTQLAGVLLAMVIISAAHAEIIDGEDFIDPTRPLIMLATQREGVESAAQNMIRNIVPSSFTVTFVRASSNSPMAVINEQRVTLGDEISGATVIAIDRSGVTLSVNNEERRYSVYQTNIKSPVTQ